MVSLTWVAPDSTTFVFSKSATNYRLLKNYSGISYNPISHLTLKAPYQNGETLVSSLAEPREVSFDVMVQSTDLDNQQTLISNLAQKLCPICGSGYLLYTKEDGTEYRLNCVGVNTPTLSPTVRSPTYQLITLDFIAHNPFWYGTTHIEYLQSTATVFFPFGFPFSLGSNSSTVVCTNDGNVDSEVTITIDGSIENPVLTNGATGEYIALNITMVAGDRMVITTGFGNKTITYYPTGGGSSNGFQYLASGSTLWSLEPGDNTIQLTDDTIAAATIISIEWSSKYSAV